MSEPMTAAMKEYNDSIVPDEDHPWLYVHRGSGMRYVFSQNNHEFYVRNYGGIDRLRAKYEVIHKDSHDATQDPSIHSQLSVPQRSSLGRCASSLARQDRGSYPATQTRQAVQTRNQQGATMTRKDYELIAAAVQKTYGPRLLRENTQFDCGWEAALGDFARNIAEELRAANTRFDTRRFLDACLPAKEQTL